MKVPYHHSNCFTWRLVGGLRVPFSPPTQKNRIEQPNEIGSEWWGIYEFNYQHRMGLGPSLPQGQTVPITALKFHSTIEEDARDTLSLSPGYYSLAAAA